MTRPYDLIVYGATGDLGRLVTQYLWAQQHSALRWAIAGRNGVKLRTLAGSFQDADPKCTAPEVVVAALNQEELEHMASLTRVVLNTVGPFCIHGTPVVAACIRHSTAYIDSSGEHVWSHYLATEYHDQAVARNAIIIPHCAIESSPPDLLAQMLVQKLQRPAGPVVFTIDHDSAGSSSGTINSVVTSLAAYSMRQIMTASAAQAFCVAGAGPHRPYTAPLVPVRRDPFLGNLEFNLSATTDEAVVMRSWSLHQRYGKRTEQYGERFSFRSYATARNWLQGWFSFFKIGLATILAILLPPLRWHLMSLALGLGTGPHGSPTGRHFVEWRATIADGAGKPAMMGVLRMNTDAYSACSVLVSEAALTVLHQLDREKSDSLAQRLGGGILTPAALGPEFLERLQAAGMERTVISLEKD
ncbi:uncharacterized protein ATNIH1004_007162 [Aspergillus tanneri]|uniref:Saccharopine dehydrogenase NADP binding domain-containing protein n=1 Tax=Aspergillus tanneri TaxID=1220188 RepID=A0A5M9ML94_9EURO|nr:uncharacterized protein ATNIH1004_007162 [Aspergillus tanneri]KAA8645743.1 hypothetical protein ATNIH1004_007162 [Aspergillus tanneri]